VIAIVLAEVARVLKPGGRFVCSTPNRRLLDPGTRITDRPFNPFHMREYTHADLDALLREFFASITWLEKRVRSPAKAIGGREVATSAKAVWDTSRHEARTCGGAREARSRDIDCRL